MTPEMDELISVLHTAGFTEKGRLRVMPGPLFRATSGQDFTCMPLAISSSYIVMETNFDKAYELANADSPDPEMELEGLDAPMWGHHSCRRCADTVARRTMHLTGATSRDIDIMFGWKEAFYSKEMQLHYETSMDRERRCLVTSML